MSILIKIAAGLALLVALIALIGLALPKNFRIERSVVINAPAEKIYPLIAEPKNWPKWGIWNRRDPNMQMEFSGAAPGAGAKWSWQSKSEGNGVMEFTAATYEGENCVQLFPFYPMSRSLIVSLRHR